MKRRKDSRMQRGLQDREIADRPRETGWGRVDGFGQRGAGFDGGFAPVRAAGLEAGKSQSASSVPHNTRYFAGFVLARPRCDNQNDNRSPVHHAYWGCHRLDPWIIFDRTG